MASDSNSPTDFLDRSQDQEERRPHSYDGPVLRNMTSDLRSQAQTSAGDSWAIASNLTPSKQRKRSSAANPITEQNLATTSTSSTPPIKVGTCPRKPKILTNLRMTKIKEFNNFIVSNRGTRSLGGMGSEGWITGLVAFMNESRRHAVDPSDVQHWLENSIDFFHEERKRVIWLWKSSIDSPPESAGTVSATASTSSSGTEETATPGNVGDDLAEPDPNPPAVMASPSGRDDLLDDLQEVTEKLIGLSLFQ